MADLNSLTDMTIPAASGRAAQLQSLANQFPAANQAVQQAQGASNTLQLQQAIGAAPSSGVSNVAPAAAGVGTAAAQQQSSQQLAARQQAGQQGLQLGEMALESRGQQLKGQQASTALAANQVYQDYSNRLNNLDQHVKNTLLDNQLAFKQNQAGQAQLNERQMMDYAVTHTQNEQQLANYQQNAEQAWAKKLYAMQTAQQKIETALANQYSLSKQQQDQQLIQQLTLAKGNIEMSLQRQQADARNKMAAWSAAGTVVGAGVGTLLAPVGGGAMGAMAGGAIGGGLAGLSETFFS